MRTDARPAFRLNLLELEGRDVPAAWFSVTAPTPAEGTVGVTDAVHTGELTLNPAYAIENGAVKVFAADPVEAATLALVGTIHVELGVVSADYVFGPATVGSAAEFQPFTATAGGSAVAIGLEDMAGLAGATPDWDRTDRTWGGVTVAPTGDPVVDTGSWTWSNSWTGEAVAVQMTVTEYTPSGYKWHYDLQNVGFSTLYPEWRGVGKFVLKVADADQVTGMTSSQPDWTPSITPGDIDWMTWKTPDNNDGSVVALGGAAWFEFLTPATPIAAAAGETVMAAIWDEPDAGRLPIGAHGVGEAKGPAKPKADIDIVGKYLDGGLRTAFDETTEDTIGGLVVRRVDNNNAPRQQISVEKLTDVAGAAVVGGKVKVTFGGSVELYDTKDGLNKLPTEKVFDNANLPVQLWVQGVAGSGTMRDVKITATPVGAGESDDVSFTVLWATVTVKGGQADKVSADNERRAFWNLDQRYGSGSPPLADELGMRYYGANIQNPGDVFGSAFEAKGSILPANFKYPGVPTILGRDIATKGFWNNARDGRPGKLPETFDNAPVAGNDLNDSLYRDDDPSDATPVGSIYGLDRPGIPVAGSPNAPTIERYRANFRQFAYATIEGVDIRISAFKLFNVKFSITQTPKAAGVYEYQVINPPAAGGVEGDNSFEVTDTPIKLTWDLK